MNNFQENELKGRAKFAALLSKKGITDYHFTEEEFNPVDCYFNQKHKCYIAEIKVRSRCYSTLYMEQSKYKAMCNIIKSGKANKGMYVNFIGNKAYLFSLDKIDTYLKEQQDNGKPTFVSRLLPKTTSGDTEKVWKMVTELPIQLAKCVNLKTE